MKKTKCHTCGRVLESSDSFSIRFKPREVVTCTDCDVDLYVPQKGKEE
jgi:RNase P subunit RPR2